MRLGRLETAAAENGKSVSTIRGRISGGELPAVKQGGRVLVDLDAAADLFRPIAMNAASRELVMAQRKATASVGKRREKGMISEAASSLAANGAER